MSSFVSDGVMIPTSIFLDTHLYKVIAVLKYISQTKVLDVVSLFLAASDNFRVPPKDVKPLTLYSLCVHYSLLARCFNSRPSSDNDEAIDEPLAKEIVRQSSVIFTSDFGSHTNFVRKNFCLLLSAMGPHSTLIYSAFYSKLRSDVSSATGRSLLALFTPPAWLSHSVSDLSKALDLLPCDIPAFLKEHRRPFCDMLRQMVFRAIDGDYCAFCAFLDSGCSIPSARALFEKLDNGKDRDGISWPAQSALLLLFRGRGDDAGSRPPRVCDAAVSADSAFLLLFLDPDQFRDHVVPALINRADATDFFRLVRRLCLFAAASTRPSMKLFEPLVEPCVNLLGRSLDLKDSRARVRPLVRGFCAYPTFLRMIVDRQIGFLELMLRTARDYGDLPIHDALINCFHGRFVEETNPTNIFWDNIEWLLVDLAKNYCRQHLCRPTPFGRAVPKVVLHIAEFLRLFFQMNETHRQIWAKGGFAPFSAIETLGLVFIASSNKDVRMAGVGLLEALVEIIHPPESFEDFALPIDDYQTLIGGARANPNLTTGHTCLTNALREIDIKTEGTRNAWEGLFYYVRALAYALNPKIHAKQEGPVGIPPDEMKGEWIGAASILFALVCTADDRNRLLKFAIELMNDRDDLGMYTAATVPAALHFRGLMEFVGLVLTNITKAPPAFAENAIQVVHVIAEQKHWRANMIEAAHFGALTSELVAFCDQTLKEELRILGAQCVVSVARLLATNNLSFDPKTRHRIAKTILGWFASVSSSSKYLKGTVQTALAFTLDDLALADCVDPADPRPRDEQVKSMFMLYFAEIKTKLDRGDTSSAIELVPVLAALLKQNFAIGIEKCIPMAFSEKNGVRAAFLGAFTSVLRVPEAKIVDPEETNKETLLDILFNDGFALIELVSGVVPYSRHEAFGALLVEAAVLRGIEMQFLARMIDIELETIEEESKNGLFRGNGVPARAVGHYPRLIGMKWMTDSLRPLFEEVLANCEKGYKYQVDPDRIEQGDNIEQNRANFRDLFEKAINTIAGSRETMPAGILRESQLLYHKVCEKYGDFATQILSGFLFLRFLLPAFMVPKMVGLPELLPDAARQALALTSTMLMVATLKGSLTDKGEHMSLHFDDLARKAQTVFNDMFTKMVTTDIGKTRSNVSVDEMQITVGLQTELWPLLQALSQAKERLEISDWRFSGLGRLIEKVQQGGRPRSVRRQRSDTATRDSLPDLLSKSFPEELLTQLSDFMVREKKPGPNDSVIYVIDFAVLSTLSDTMIVPYIVLRKLREETSGSVILIYSCGSFDESKIPPASVIVGFQDTPLMKKVKRVLIIEPTETFVGWLSRNPQLLDRADRYVFVKDLIELSELAGATPNGLPPTALESLTEPDSSMKAIVNGTEKQVRLHHHSVEFVGPAETIQGYEVFPVTVIMVQAIKQFVRPRDSGKNTRIFSLIAGDGPLYQIETNQSSSLYEGIIAVTKRIRTLGDLKNRVMIDTSTLQWLMLNLAFINMIRDKEGPIVRKAALDLIYAVFSSFSFNHEIQIMKVSIDSIPDNLVNFVTTLSEDIAKHNPDCFDGFLTEYFKVYDLIEDSCKPVTFLFLNPWIRQWAAAIDERPDFVGLFVNAYIDLPSASTEFCESIWREVSCAPAALDELNRHILARASDALLDLPVRLAVYAPASVTNFWVERVLMDASGVVFSCSVVSRLLACHVFDYNGAGGLIYGVFRLRLFFADDMLWGFVPLLANLLHFLVRMGGSPIGLDYAVQGIAFCAGGPLRDFRDGRPRAWLDRTGVLAGAASAAAAESALRAEVFKRFREDALDESADAAVRASGLLFAAAFSGQRAQEIAAVAVARAPAEAAVAAAALAQIPMDTALAARLFVAGAALALFAGSDALPLLAAAARQIGAAPEIGRFVPQEVMAKLQSRTGLDWDGEPVYAAVVLFAVLADEGEEPTVADFVATGRDDPMERMIGLVIEGDGKEVAMAEFGEKTAAALACALSLLRVVKSEELLEFVITLAEKRPEVLAGLKIWKGPIGSQIMKAVSDVKLTALFAEAMAHEAEKVKLPTVLAPLFDSQLDPVRISNEEIAQFLEPLFS
jgi:hypothetical protein